MTFKYYLILLFSIICVKVMSQNPVEIDKALSGLKHDTARVAFLNAKGEELYLSDPDKALQLWEQALGISTRTLAGKTNTEERKVMLNHHSTSLNNIGAILVNKGARIKALEYFIKSAAISEELNDSLNAAYVYNNIGYLYDETGSMDNAIKYYRKAEFIFKKYKDTKAATNALNNIGLIYNHRGNIPLALETFHSALKMAEVNGEKSLKAYILSNLGEIYGELQDSVNALKYIYESLKIRIAINDKRGIAYCYNSLGYHYAKNGHNKTALDYYNKSLSIRESVGDKTGIAVAMHNIGMIYSRMKDFDKAMEIYFASLALEKESGNKRGIAETSNNIGYLYANKKDYGNALEYAKQSYKLSKELKSPEKIRNAAELLAKIYDAKGRKANAYDYYKEFVKMKDSVINENNQKEAIRQTYQYEWDKHEAAIKSEHDKKTAIANAEKKKQQIVIFFIAGIALLIGLIALITFRSLRITKKQKNIITEQKQMVDAVNEELNQQNEEIAAQRDLIEHQKGMVEEKQKEIIDSINYAQRIQRAVLTPESYIKEKLGLLKNATAAGNDYFILFKPKDIVSGDFYWFYSNDEELYYFTGDCTGHGVPGGFMSMLGINLLNELVIERGIREPAEILNKLRDEIVKALKTDGLQAKDGLDGVMCKIDFKKLLLTYSGANNGFYIVRENKLLEFKSDKMPVGYMDQMPGFNQYVVELAKADVIYTFTDGYADQFGGPKGKKFMYKRFEEKLLQICHLSVSDQYHELDLAITKWQGELNQVDDICVIGLKV